MSQVVNHLLFHKAMVGIDIDRVDQYIEIASGASSAHQLALANGLAKRGLKITLLEKK